MSPPVERELQRPCGWCGQVVVQPGGRRRLRRYCSQSCRQRAYEDRRAAARRAPDWQPPEQAERVVEVQPRYPTTIDGWERALAELARQLGDNTIGFWNRHRVEAALDAVRNALPTPPTRTTRPVPADPSPSLRAPARPAVDGPVLRWLVKASGRPTTLRLLAGELAIAVDQVRAVLVDCVAADVIDTRRTTPIGAVPVDLAVMPDHARFTITVL